jgi:phage shock protein PspC (stress-responsive transcriptional regulator)
MVRRLTRSRTEGKVAGVCAGLADYLDVDVVLVRTAWVILSVVPGAIIGGILAYLGAWLIVPPETEPVARPRGPRLTLSASDRKLAGVCGGLAEYFNVDATMIRLIWVVASVLFAAVIGGIVAYLLAWIIMPRRQDIAFHSPAPASPQA